MTILRIERYARFTNVPNEAIEDSRLSFRARGILVYLLSKPDTWDARSEQLVAAGREGRDAIRTAFGELEEFGYMDRDKEQYVADNGKKLWRTVVLVRDLPKTGFQSSETRPSETQALTANTEQQRLNSKGKKTSSSPSSRTRSARSSDDGPDQSTLDSINDELRPGTRPQPLANTRRVTRSRKPPAEHIHNPTRPDAGGLACYWGRELEKVGSLEKDEEAVVGKFFKVWLGRGLDVNLARAMVDLFFADPEMAESSHRWRRFVANAETLRLRVLADQGGYLPGVDDEPEFDWVDRLPAYLKEALAG